MKKILTLLLLALVMLIVCACSSENEDTLEQTSTPTNRVSDTQAEAQLPLVSPPADQTPEPAVIGMPESTIPTPEPAIQTPTPEPIVTPSPRPATIPLSQDIETGNLVHFGAYTWRVLDVQDGKALLLTENTIHRMAFRCTTRIRGFQTWEYSNVREWLNRDFYRTFTYEERNIITEVDVINNPNPWFYNNDNILNINTNDTTDKIFLLSVEEVVHYFGDSGQLENTVVHGYTMFNVGTANPQYVLITLATRIDDEYNLSRIALRDDRDAVVMWWLRTNGSSGFRTAYVQDDGTIVITGGGSSFLGGVRPALWLNLEFLD